MVVSFTQLWQIAKQHIIWLGFLISYHTNVVSHTKMRLSCTTNRNQATLDYLLKQGTVIGSNYTLTDTDKLLFTSKI